MLVLCAAIVLCAGPLIAQPASVATPTVPDECPPKIRHLLPGVSLSEVATDPAVKTPTGIDVDALGRIWAVSSHTHFRPDKYEGPKHDSVMVYSDEDGDGRFETTKLFYQETDATMDLELGPGGWVYLAERDRILRVRDSDGDGEGDVEEDIAVLKSTATYPHNGHAGLAWHPSGDLVFALGENFHKEWTLTGRDGSQVKGFGEGGIFRCRPDGSKLRRIARGFWNPFGVVVRHDGEIFAAENDPGSRPPCRLLHIVEGGDYGYQRLYGRAPFHPFVAWNGEVRGTLPMVSPTGEAPCGIATLGGGLIVPSWADNRIDFFPLEQTGASYQADRVKLLRGSDFFRPTCIKQVSQYTYFLTDWVFGSYELHGRGRIWKLEIDPSKAAEWLQPSAPEPLNEDARLARRMRSGRGHQSTGELFRLAGQDDPFLAQAAITALAGHARFWDAEAVRRFSSEQRVSAALALRKARPNDSTWPRHFLHDANPEVVFQALRWIADKQLTGFEADVEAILQEPDQSFRLFEAALACWNTITGNPRVGVADTKMLIQRVRDDKAAPAIRSFALRLLPANSKLTDKELLRLIQVNDPELSREAIRSLAARPNQSALKVLARLAADSRLETDLRVEALVGLARDSETYRDLLIKLAADEQAAIRHESLRALRFVSLEAKQQQALEHVAEEHRDSRELVRAVLSPASLAQGQPESTDLQDWTRRLGKVAGNAAAGRRIFFHPKVALCATCHRHGGRGVVLGPDLSAVADRDKKDWLLHAILQPNKDVAPQFYPWSITTKDGEEFTGILLRKGGRSGKEFYRDSTGREHAIVKTEIASRRELKSSMMPEGLLTSLTDQEIRDLLVFLRGEPDTE